MLYRSVIHPQTSLKKFPMTSQPSQFTTVDQTPLILFQIPLIPAINGESEVPITLPLAFFTSFGAKKLTMALHILVPKAPISFQPFHPVTLFQAPLTVSQASVIPLMNGEVWSLPIPSPSSDTEGTKKLRIAVQVSVKNVAIAVHPLHFVILFQTSLIQSQAVVRRPQRSWRPRSSIHP